MSMKGQKILERIADQDPVFGIEEFQVHPVHKSPYLDLIMVGPFKNPKYAFNSSEIDASTTPW